MVVYRTSKYIRFVRAILLRNKIDTEASVIFHIKNTACNTYVVGSKLLHVCCSQIARQEAQICLSVPLKCTSDFIFFSH